MINNILKKNSRPLVNTIIFLFIFAIIFFGFYFTTFAATDNYVPLESLPGIGDSVEISTSGFNTYLDGVFRLLIGIAIALAVLMIAVGGIQYVSSFVPSAKENAKSRIIAAIWGLVLALGSWILLNTINPDILKTNFGVEPTSVKVQKFSTEIPQYWFEWKYSSEDTYKQEGAWVKNACESARKNFVAKEKKDGATVQSNPCFKKITQEKTGKFYFTWGTTNDSRAQNLKGPYITATVCNKKKKEFIKDKKIISTFCSPSTRQENKTKQSLKTPKEYYFTWLDFEGKEIFSEPYKTSGSCSIAKNKKAKETKFTTSTCSTSQKPRISSSPTKKKPASTPIPNQNLKKIPRIVNINVLDSNGNCLKTYKEKFSLVKEDSRICYYEEKSNK